jgi:transmembrane sensor
MSANNTGIEELLSDDTFLSWYFRTDPAGILKWEEWMAADTANRALALQAAECLGTLRLQERPLDAAQLTQAIHRLLESIKGSEKESGPEKESTSQKRPVNTRIPGIPVRLRWVAAASVLLLAAGLYGRHELASRKSSLITAYGEVRNSLLPDGTEVVANADTRLTYPKDWKDGSDREVWLAGEAFFHVSKTPLKSRFIVHTDHFDIIVTGTQFNAVNRPDKASILLQEGSVTLLGPDEASMKLLPGDFVEFREGQLYKRPVKADSCLAWKDRRLFLDNTPLSRLVEIIREQYGVTVEPADERTAARTVSCILPNDNLEGLLRALELTGDFKIVREKDRIIIKDH